MKNIRNTLQEAIDTNKYPEKPDSGKMGAEVVDVIDENTEENEVRREGVRTDLNEGRYNIRDLEGNVIAYIDSDGIHAPNTTFAKSNILDGKEIYTLGDSLCIEGYWQNKLVELSGCTFDSAKNYDSNNPEGDHLSRGGSKTMELEGDNSIGYRNCAHIRAKFLANYTGVDDGVIFIENINDSDKYATNAGTINDTPYFLDNVIIYPTPFADLASLNAFLASGFDAYLAGFIAGDRKVGSGIQFEYDNGGVATYVGKYFVSYDTADWETLTEWKDIDEVSLYSIYKGLLGYLCSTYPNAQIYFISHLRSYYYFTDPAYQHADGSPDIDAYYSSSLEGVSRNMFAVQEDVSNMFRIPYINCNILAGINAYNADQFYDEGNVHPNQAGQEKVGETIYKYL